MKTKRELLKEYLQFREVLLDSIYTKCVSNDGISANAQTIRALLHIDAEIEKLSKATSTTRLRGPKP